MDALLTKKLQHCLLGLQHLGFVVPDLEQALADWQQLYGLTEAQFRRPAGVPADAPVRFAFIEIAGQEFELMQPVAEPYLSLLNGLKSGEGGINHLAWRVRDLAEAQQLLQQQGVRPGYVTPDGPVCFGRKKMLYLDPATTGGQLIELIEMMASTPSSEVADD